MKLYIVYKDNTVTETMEDYETLPCDIMGRIIGVYSDSNKALARAKDEYNSQVRNLSVENSNVTQVTISSVDVDNDWRN